MIEHQNFCMAPWVHAMHDANYTRMACCTSDVPTDLTTAKISKFADFQNSEHMKSIRKNFMAGIMPQACHRCNVNSHSVTSVKLFKDFWNEHYGQYYQQAMALTLPSGETSFQPVYYDYRFGNTCNYKCRHCSSVSSSSIELEEKQYGLLPGNPEFHVTVDSDNRNQILYNELKQAADQRRLKAVQWIGGEPLFSVYHWQFMNYLQEIELFDVSVSYITNLSIIEFKGKKLGDLLEPFIGASIHVSSESGGLAAEYIRRGMNWTKFTNNVLEIKSKFADQHNVGFRDLSLGLTLTVFSICGLEQWIEFLVKNNIKSAAINIVKPNDNNLYLGFESLGQYKQQWLDSFIGIVNRHKHVLNYETYRDLMSAADIINNLPTYNHQSRMPRSLHYARTLDKIDQHPSTQDVIGNWPFLQQWWKELNEQYQQ